MLLKQVFTAGLGGLALCLVLVNAPVGAEGMVLTGNVETTVSQEIIQDSKAPGIVGLDMVIRPGMYAVVRDVFRHSPAHQAGMRPGDRIIAVDGKTTMGMDTVQLDIAISDIPGTPVILTIQRADSVKNIELRVASLAEVHPSLRALFLSSSY